MKRSLSDMKREKPREPFVLTVHDAAGAERDVEFTNPKSLHWTKLTELDELPPGEQIATLIADPEQLEAFREDPELDGEALEWVMGEYRTHYGLGAPGEAPGSAGS